MAFARTGTCTCASRRLGGGGGAVFFGITACPVRPDRCEGSTG